MLKPIVPELRARFGLTAEEACLAIQEARRWAAEHEQRGEVIDCIELF